MKTCSFEWEGDPCGRPRARRDLCQTHDVQRRRGEPLRPIRHRATNGSFTKCILASCPNPRSSRHGYCTQHAAQARRGEQPSAIPDRKQSSTVIIEGNTARVAIMSGETVVAWADVDVEDADAVRPYRWTLSSRYAATRLIPGGPKVLMHRHILGLLQPPPPEVDHQDGDTLNNRRLNLRLVDHARNAQNTRHQSRPPDMRNVYWKASRSKWAVHLMARGVRHDFGLFADLAEAKAVARAARARLLPYANEARHRAFNESAPD